MKDQEFLPLSGALMAYSHAIGHVGENRFLLRIEEAARTHPLSIMMSAKEETKLLQLLVCMLKAKLVVEVGVFLGYTTLALAQALPTDDGRVIGLDINRDFTSVGCVQYAISFHF